MLCCLQQRSVPGPFSDVDDPVRVKRQGGSLLPVSSLAEEGLWTLV